jgi:hypothetical protein
MQHVVKNNLVLLEKQSEPSRKKKGLPHPLPRGAVAK